jgi:hypothetical protein
MSKRKKDSLNWKITGVGVGLLLFGLIFLALVGSNYYGIPGLIASSLLILGVISIFWGLAVNLEEER